MEEGERRMRKASRGKEQQRLEKFSPSSRSKNTEEVKDKDKRR